MTEGQLSRRGFVKSSAALAGALALSGRVLAEEPVVPKLNVACIGVGGRGESAVDAMLGENIVALCDVDEARAAKSFGKAPDAKRFKDYREMFVALGDKIDAVTVSTPDHSHFQPAMMAMALGMHVFVEKPLAHSVWEARQLRLAAEQYGVATQMGNQGHANEGTRLLREWVQAGAIGPVREVHHWTDRPIWPQGLGCPDHSKAIPVCPSSLDWDLWVGCAPERPYDPAYAPFDWRGWWDFGTGALGDMGCHIMDGAFWALDLGSPTRIEAVTTPVNAETAPASSVVTYQFPARGSHPAVRVNWYDGGLRPAIPAELEADREWESNGSLLVGDDGYLLSNTYGSSVRIIPEARMKEFKARRPEKTIPRIKGGHYAEWLRACRGGPPAGSNFDYSARLTESVLLGNVALRAGRPIEWDAEKMEVTNYPEAQRFLRREYRDGWGV